MNFPVYLGLLHHSEQTLAGAFRQVSRGHGDEPDIFYLCQTLARQCDEHVEALQAAIVTYGEASEDDEPERLYAAEMSEKRSGPLGLLRDLQDLYLLANLVDATWMVVKQVALSLPDEALLDVVDRCERETGVQLDWLKTRMKQAAPQALIVAR
jgi:hypothetical protein